MSNGIFLAFILFSMFSIAADADSSYEIKPKSVTCEGVHVQLDRTSGDYHPTSPTRKIQIDMEGVKNQTRYTIDGEKHSVPTDRLVGEFAFEGGLLFFINAMEGKKIVFQVGSDEIKSMYQDIVDYGDLGKMREFDGMAFLPGKQLNSPEPYKIHCKVKFQQYCKPSAAGLQPTCDMMLRQTLVRSGTQKTGNSAR